MTQIKSEVGVHRSDTVRLSSSYNDVLVQSIDKHEKELRSINEKIHSNPELGYHEFKAHDNITQLLRELGFKVTPHAYGVETSFLAEYGSGGRVVAYNAEYDALPEIGHACGHNVIATASIGAFLGVAAALKESNLPGRVRLIGTPAEEGGGGKLPIIDAGAYEDVSACLMVHPMPDALLRGSATGSAYSTSLANIKFRVHFTGKPAHAAMAPWQGVNALDAVCLAYNGVSMLRQQIQPHERIHGVIVEGGTRPNVITARTSVEYYCRSATLDEAEALKDRVVKCFEGAATATGCSFEYEAINNYADLRPNKTICSEYTSAMKALGSSVICDFDTEEPGAGSTDMGNVTYACPGFHATFGTPAENGAFNHTPGFTSAAGTSKAHDLTIMTAKGMAITGWKVLTDDVVARRVRKNFVDDKKLRERVLLLNKL